jgi:hypothetical protein
VLRHRQSRRIGVARPKGFDNRQVLARFLCQTPKVILRFIVPRQCREMPEERLKPTDLAGQEALPHDSAMRSCSRYRCAGIVTDRGSDRHHPTQIGSEFIEFIQRVRPAPSRVASHRARRTWQLPRLPVATRGEQWQHDW